MTETDTDGTDHAVERIKIVPIGEVGDGGVWLRHDPNPPHNRSKYELEYDWGTSVDTVYLGGEDQLQKLIAVLERYVDTETDRFGRKGIGYCFDCRTEFPMDKLASACPNCGSDWWVATLDTDRRDPP